MSTLRIRSTSADGRASAATPPNPAKEYLDRLVKLIPAEVVGIYLAGKSLIQSTYGPDPLPGTDPRLPVQTAYMLGWTLSCLAAIIVVRAWATTEPKQASGQAKGPQWGAVAIATVSYVIWVYSFGDIFRFYGTIWSALGAGLLVLAWTFIVPLIYRGDSDAGAHGTAHTPVAPWWPRLGAPSRAPVELPHTPPANFTEADAEQAVITGASELHVAVSLSDTISDRFSSARQMRKLLGSIQDVILRIHGIWVDLSTQSEEELEKLRAKSYANLALWTHSKVVSTGQSSTQRWELDE